MPGFYDFDVPQVHSVPVIGDDCSTRQALAENGIGGLRHRHSSLAKS